MSIRPIKKSSASTRLNFLAAIERKRDGAPLPADTIRQFVIDYTRGDVPDYQAAALLMAVFFRGMNAEETSTLTLAMRDSGEVLHFPADSRPVVDKHSTGGVGDKISLPLAPLLACLNFRVPMISGRGLGITGGTLDKLESIPGLTTQLEPARIVEQVQDIGVAMAGQTASMVPADRKLYALRDVTGTVPSIPLITASILSKKLAEGLDALIMDVKFGSAAFMQTEAQARDLARAIVTLARDCGVNTRALLTDMNTPLGHAAGNWLEVKESIECLEGRGPADVRELVLECAAQLLHQTQRSPSLDQARDTATACLDSGEPRRKWNELIAAQGADLDAFHRQLAVDALAPVVRELRASRSGYVTRCDARLVGEIVRDLGGGRLIKDTAIQPHAGIDAITPPGEPRDAGAILCRVHASTETEADAAIARLESAFEISDQSPAPRPRILTVID